MIDAHVHFGAIPDKTKNWGNFGEYKNICKKTKINKYCLVPIGLPENFTEKTTPDNNLVLALHEFKV